MPCIELLTKEGSNGFQCPVCDTFHQQPQNAYLKNTTLAKLCEKKANKVSRSRIGDNFHAQLDELELKMKKIAHEKELGADKIKVYCDGLRNKVQMHLMEFTESINKHSMELIEMIDKYQNEATFKFDNTDTAFNLILDNVLNETRSFHEKWTDYLNQFKIDNDELKLASKEAKKMKINLNKLSDMMLEQTFNFNVLKLKKFRPYLGSLVRCDIKQSYTYALDCMKLHKMSSKMESIDKISFKRLNNGNLCVAYRKINDFSIRVIVYDNSFNQLFSNSLRPYEKNLQKFKILESDNAIILALLKETSETNTVIVKLDFNLNILTEKSNSNLKICDVDVHQDKFYFLNTYKETMNFSKFINASGPDLTTFTNMSPPCIPGSVSKFKVNKNYFVFLNESNVLN